jgi:hypothetical protein
LGIRYDEMSAFFDIPIHYSHDAPQGTHGDTIRWNHRMLVNRFNGSNGLKRLDGISRVRESIAYVCEVVHNGKGLPCRAFAVVVRNDDGSERRDE